MTNKEQLIERLINTGIVDKNLHSIFTGKAQVLVDQTELILITYDMKDMRRYKIRSRDISYGDFDSANKFIDKMISDMKSEFKDLLPRQLQIVPTTSLFDLNRAFSTLFEVRKVEPANWYMTSPSQLLKAYQDILNEHFEN